MIAFYPNNSNDDDIRFAKSNQVCSSLCLGWDSSGDRTLRSVQGVAFLSAGLSSTASSASSAQRRRGARAGDVSGGRHRV